MKTETPIIVNTPKDIEHKARNENAKEKLAAAFLALLFSLILWLIFRSGQRVKISLNETLRLLNGIEK